MCLDVPEVDQGFVSGLDPFRRQFFNTFNISRGLKQDFSVFIE